MKNKMNYWSPFYDMADNPQYLYIYVKVLFAWGLKPSKCYLFLHDTKIHKTQCIEKEGRVVKLPLFHKRINVDKMFNFNLYDKLISSYTDVTTYYIYMKSGDRERTLNIDSPEKYRYKPFHWLLDTIDNDNGNHHPKMERIMYRLLTCFYKTNE